MSDKPISGSQIISGKTGKSVSSTAIVQQRLSRQRSASRLVKAGRVGLVVLLGLASIGMVFTLKHRSVRPQPKTPELASSQTVPIAAAKQRIPKARPPVTAASKPVKPRATLELLPIPAFQLEQLAIGPRLAVNDSIADKTNSEPPGFAAEKSRPEQTVGSKEYENPVPAVVDDDRSRANAAARLAPTGTRVDTTRNRTFGTRVEFMTDVPATWVDPMADKSKLVLIVTYAGPFRNGSFVSANAERFRKDCLMNDDVADFLEKNDFVCVMQCVSGLPQQDGAKTDGNVVTYFCQNDKSVLHAISGPVDAAEFLRQAYWILAVRKNALADFKIDSLLYANRFRKAHNEKYQEANDKQRLVPNELGRLGLDPDPQKQIHSLLAGFKSEPLPKFETISKRIYVRIMKEPLYPR
jgi:hypothetical protein